MPSVTERNSNQNDDQKYQQDWEAGLVRSSIDRVSLLAGSISTRAKASSTIAKFGLDQFDRLSRPIFSTMACLGDPFVEKVDNGINRAIKVFRRNEDLLDKEEPLRARVSKLGSRIVESSWFNRVDSIIGFQAFFQAAQEQWQQSKTKNRDENVSKEEFLNGLRIRLAGFWDDSLRPIAEAFYVKALETFSRARPRVPEVGEDSHGEGKTQQRRDSGEIWSDIQAQFGSVWEQRVVSAWQRQVVSPATTLYASALNFYLTTKPTDSAKTFTEGMRARLGQAWNDSLEQPLREFYTGAKQMVQDDLLALQDKLQRLMPNIHTAAVTAHSLTLGDVVDGAKGAVTYVQSRVRRAVSGAWHFVVAVSQATLDVVLPPSQSSIEDKKGEPGEEYAVLAPSLHSVREEAIKRVKAHAGQHWAQIRKLSSNQLKNLIRIDLIASAEQVIDSKVKPKYEGLQKKFGLVVENVQNRFYNGQIAVAKLRASVRVPPALAPLTDSLQRRITKVKQRARDISARGSRYLFSREIMKIPGDVIRLPFQVPLIMIALVTGSELNGEFTELTQELRAFFKAVKEVLIWSRQSSCAGQNGEDIPIVRARDQERTDLQPSQPRTEEEEEEEEEEEDGEAAKDR